MNPSKNINEQRPTLYCTRKQILITPINTELRYTPKGLFYRETSETPSLILNAISGPLKFQSELQPNKKTNLSQDPSRAAVSTPTAE